MPNRRSKRRISGRQMNWRHPHDSTSRNRDVFSPAAPEEARGGWQPMSAPANIVTDIRAALAVLTEPGQVVELRVIGVDGRANRTDSGYFDDMDALAKVAARYDGRAAAIYITLHPVMPALRARAANRMQEWAKTTTNDTETTCRRWLNFDTDATRPTGISSTDEEHEAALARARAIRERFRERGWPEPVYADSGNGGHLLYRIDLPADDTGLTQRVLAAVAILFDDRIVKIDRTVYNPARIWKLYGTQARKGDSTPDRPHRRARIIDAPEVIEPVPYALLEELAGDAPDARGTRHQGDFDVEAYLRAHGIGFTGPVDYDGGKKWLLDACVWNGHSDKAAIVTQKADGTIGANCSHNSCEGKGWKDLRDAVEPGWRKEAAARQRAYEERVASPSESPGDLPKKAGKRPPQRDDLIALADDAELFHTPQGIPYATFAVGSHHETHRLTSRGFREWLAHQYYREHGGSANTQAVQDACTALAGRARYAGPEHPVFIRLAEIDDTIYLDLCDAAWRVVAIDADGWRIITDAPVRFRRTRGMLALPTPVDAGTLETLKTRRRFFNLLPEADWILIQAALIAAMRPRGPYPILAFRSEQGSGKSTRMKMMRSLIDPNTAPLRTMPRDERDLMIAASNGHYMNFDNVSTIPAWLSDAFCRLSTGGGFATREMYADDDETILDAQRPILLNGITDFATRSDLLDRLIVVDLPRIPDSERQTEAALWLAFEQVRPAIIGALLTAVSTAMRNLPTTTLATMPRMADFALWVTAAAPALGWKPDTFLTAYTKNRANAHELAIESSLVAATLIRFIEREGQWEGRASDLLAALTPHADEATSKHRDWPKDATRLSSELRRLAPNLRAVGVSMDWPKARTILLTWTGTPRQEDERKSASSASSASSDTDEASNSNGNEDNAIAGDSVTGAQASVIHNADSVIDDATKDAASRHEANAGKGNNADNADNAEKPPHSSSRTTSRTTSRPITDRDLPGIFPDYRGAATSD